MVKIHIAIILLGLCLVCNSAGFDSDTNEMSIFLGKLFVRAIQELWQWWSRLLHVVVDTEEEEAVVEAVTTVGILGFCKELPNKLSLKNIEKVTRRAQEQFQMVLEEKSRFAFDVDLDAPKVRIPLRSRGSARCDSYFLLDFGHFTLHTAESQSDEQRHNLYSRFYISGRDFAAFFTDYGSDFGSCSLVKPTHDSQIISSPWAKEADNVYSVIDRCGMAVLVNQIKVPHPSYPSTCISIQVPNLCIHFSPERFCRIMEMLSILPRLWKHVISLHLIVYTPNLLLGVVI
ncbi:uncharacterized protein [Arachis hypogaea]|uniref:uncharacterized protein isoform X1 n=2 Tax=Arachis hypogaea TaxID=3818 RepID=UPI000DECC4D6|nr:uncharacterized protein LOC112727486 isoform X3 [Arachis hypogaea]XP_025633028.1 uncharacterized protein LOC112727486 isoform X3 [Arachis hypogaea]